MGARAARICPACTQPIRQGANWAARNGLRYHLGHEPSAHGGRREGAGARALPAGEARTELVRVRLTPAEKASLAAHCALLGRTESEVIRERLAGVIG